jgi:hypothetical protein
MADELVSARSLYSTAETEAQKELDAIKAELAGEVDNTLEERALAKWLLRASAKAGNVELAGSLIALSDKLSTSARVSAQATGRLVEVNLMLRFVRGVIDLIAEEFQPDYSEAEFGDKCDRIRSRLDSLWEVTRDQYGEPDFIHGQHVSKVRK